MLKHLKSHEQYQQAAACMVNTAGNGIMEANRWQDSSSHVVVFQQLT
jgi:hypothetical protein